LLSKDPNEKIASENVITFLHKYYPKILDNTDEYFLKREDGNYICGVKIQTNVKFRDGAPLFIQKAAAKQLVLKTEFHYDPSIYKEMLNKWANENGFLFDSKSFYILYIKYSWNNSPKIKVCVNLL